MPTLELDRGVAPHPDIHPSAYKPRVGGPGLPERQRRRLQLWFWSIAVATLVIVAVGGITRLTRSGLSIVEWRPIAGVVPPLTALQWEQAFAEYQRYPEYQQLRRGMTIGEFRSIYFWEYLHRLAARAIGVVFLIPLVLFWRAGYLNRAIASRAGVLLALGLTQGVMGWLMVKSGLVDRPSVSHYRLAAHLMLALTIFGASVWFARELATPLRPRRLPAGVRHFLVRALFVVGLLLLLQIAWGAFVAGLRAGLFFNTFPLIGGQALPPGGLALEPAVLNLVANPVTVQWVHRLLGTALLVATAVVFIRVRRVAADPQTRRLNAWLLSLTAVQYALGVVTLLYHVPVVLGVAHQVGAVAVAGVWVIWMHDVRAATWPAPYGPAPLQHGARFVGAAGREVVR